MKLLNVAIVALLFCGLAQAEPRRKSAPRSQPSYNAYEPARASGGGGQRMAGCGLGSMAVEDNSKWAQVGASLLNGTGMQTFAISFGTSNCTEDGVATAGREKDAFVESNLADLRRDVAAGEGEYLSALANLYGCEPTSFGAALRRHQEKILLSPAEEANGLIERVVREENLGCRA